MRKQSAGHRVTGRERECVFLCSPWLYVSHLGWSRRFLKITSQVPKLSLAYDGPTVQLDRQASMVQDLPCAPTVWDPRVHSAPGRPPVPPG